MDDAFTIATLSLAGRACLSWKLGRDEIYIRYATYSKRYASDLMIFINIVFNRPLIVYTN
jgi:hypothetical protein